MAQQMELFASLGSPAPQAEEGAGGIRPHAMVRLARRYLRQLASGSEPDSCRCDEERLAEAAETDGAPQRKRCPACWDQATRRWRLAGTGRSCETCSATKAAEAWVALVDVSPRCAFCCAQAALDAAEHYAGQPEPEHVRPQDAIARARGAMWRAARQAWRDGERQGLDLILLVDVASDTSDSADRRAREQAWAMLRELERLSYLPTIMSAGYLRRTRQMAYRARQARALAGLSVEAGFRPTPITRHVDERHVVRWDQVARKGRSLVCDATSMSRIGRGSPMR